MIVSSIMQMHINRTDAAKIVEQSGLEEDAQDELLMCIIQLPDQALQALLPSFSPERIVRMLQRMHSA